MEEEDGEEEIEVVDVEEKVEEKEEVRIKVTCQLFSVSRLGLYDCHLRLQFQCC